MTGESLTQDPTGTVEPLDPVTARNRALIALVVPLAVGLLAGLLTGALAGLSTPGFQTTTAPVFAGFGSATLLLGLRWYGLRGLGLRGGRPLFASIGFAVLAWVVVLLARFLPGLPSAGFNEAGQVVVEATMLIETVTIRSAGAGRAFVYLLLFEAFATQLWTYGLLFRSLADWRGPLAAAAGSGVVFSAAAFVFYEESFLGDISSMPFFLAWGVLYGVIRLRTGSILGTVLVQALQSFTAWFVFQPPDDLTQTSIRTVYLFISAAFAIIIWRLWPRRESDYRI